MYLPTVASISLLDIVAPVIAAGVFIAFTALLKKPTRHQFGALMISGAGFVYFGGCNGPNASSCELNKPSLASLDLSLFDSALTIRPSDLDGFRSRCLARAFGNRGRGRFTGMDATRLRPHRDGLLGVIDCSEILWR